MTDSPPHLPAAAQMDISLFSTCLPLQLCMLISRLYRRGFHLFHKEKICHDYPEKKNRDKKRSIGSTWTIELQWQHGKTCGSVII